MSVRTFKVEAGKLRFAVSINMFTLVPDGSGGSAKVKTTVANVKVFLRPLNGQEMWSALQQKMSVTTYVEMRYLPDLKNDMWLTFEGRDFAIRSITDVEMRHRKLILWCEERRDLK